MLTLLYIDANIANNILQALFCVLQYKGIAMSTAVGIVIDMERKRKWALGRNIIIKLSEF